MEKELKFNSPFTLFNKALGSNCTLNKKLKHVPPVDDQQEKEDAYYAMIRNLVCDNKKSWGALNREKKNGILKAYLQKLDRYDLESIFYSTKGKLLLIEMAYKMLDEVITPSRMGEWVYKKLHDDEIIAKIQNDFDVVSGKKKPESINPVSDEDELRDDDNRDRHQSIANWG